MIRVVLDSNEYVSALIKPKSLPAKILQAAHDKQISLITSLSIRQELERVLHYPRIKERYKVADTDIHKLMDSLAKETLNTEEKISVDVVNEDPEDNKYLACALEGNADYIVSGDRHLLQLKTYRGIKILNPRSFLLVLEANFK